MGYTPEERQKYIDELKAYAEERPVRESGHQHPKQADAEKVTDLSAEHVDQKAQGQRPTRGIAMKLIVVALLSLLVGGVLALTGTSSDTPDISRLTPDQVVTVAKSYSPHCECLVPQTQTVPGRYIPPSYRPGRYYPGQSYPDGLYIPGSYTPARFTPGEQTWETVTYNVVEYVQPSFVPEYLGDGVWSVTKTCPVNPEFSGSWYFYEDTGEFVEQ